MEYSLLLLLITILMAGGLGQAADVYMVLGNSMIHEHSLVNLNDLGDSNETGLRCVTERVDCCSGDNGTRAEWFDPSNRSAGIAFIRSRNGVGSAKGYVNLFQRIIPGGSSYAQQGIYHCNIPAPSPSNAIRTFYIGIYKDNKGMPTITSITYDQLSSEIFTLTCISTGGPATNVIWTLNGSEITGVNHTLTQTVVNTATAEYNNTLTVTGREAGNYQCTVSNARGSDTSQLFLMNFTEQPTEVIVASSYNHQPASSSKLMSSSITPNPLSTPPTDMSMACNSAVVGSAMAAVLLVVTVILSIVIVLLVLRLRHLSSSPQKNPGVEMLSGSGAIPVEECVAYGPQRGKGGGGGGGERGGGGAFYSEPAYEMGVISEQPVVGKTVLSSTTEETVYEQIK